MLAAGVIAGSSGDRFRGVYFDGTDRVSLTSGGSSVTTNTLLVSLWFRTGFTTDSQYLFTAERVGSSSNYGIYLNMNANGSLTIIGDDAYDVTKLTRTTVATGFNDNQWHHYLFYRKGSTGTDLLYIDGVAAATTGIVSSSTIGWNNLELGHNVVNDLNPYTGSLAEVIITSIDPASNISNQAVRDKFILNNKPVDVGSDASLALDGNPALYYFSRRTGDSLSDFANNRGINGTYTTTGPLTDPNVRVIVGL